MIHAALAQVTPTARAIGARAARAGMVDPLRARLELAVTETLANIVRHAYADAGGPIGIRCRARADAFEVELRDHGRALGSIEVGDERGGLGTAAESGRGLWLARACVTRIAYRREHDVNVWRLEQRTRE